MAGSREEYVVAIKVQGDRQLRALLADSSRLGASVARSTKAGATGMTKFGASVSSVYRLVGGLSAGLLALKSITTFRDFERSLSGVKAVTQSTAAEMLRLEGVARQMGATTQFTASDAADAMENLGRAGFKSGKIIGALPATLNLAAAAKMGLARASEITAKAMAGFGLEAAEADRVSDALAVVAANANTNVEEMGDALKYAGPAAKVAGQSIEETAAAIGILSNAGISGSMAGTGLRMMFKNLASATPKAKEALREMGVEIEDLNPATHSLVEITRTLADAGLDLEHAFRIFDARAATSVLALVEMADDLAVLTDKTNASEGAAKRMADTVQDNLWGSMKLLISGLQDVAIAFGKELGPGLREMMIAARDLAVAFSGTAQAGGSILGDALKILGGILRFAADNVEALKIALAALIALKLRAAIVGWAEAGSHFAAMLTQQTVATTRLGAAVAGLQVKQAFAAMLNPITLVTAAVVALTYAISKLSKASIEASDKAIDGMSKASQIAGDLVAQSGGAAYTPEDVAAAKQKMADLRAYYAELVKQRSELAKQTTTVKTYDAETRKWTTTTKQNTTALKELDANIAATGAAMTQAARAVDQMNARMVEAPDPIEKTRAAISELSDELKELGNSGLELAARFDPVLAATIALMEGEKALNAAFEQGKITVDQKTNALKHLNRELDTAKRKAAEAQTVYGRTTAGEPIDVRTKESLVGVKSDTVREMEQTLARYKEYEKLVKSTVKGHAKQKALLAEIAESLGLGAKNAAKGEDSFATWIQAAESLANILGTINGKMGAIVKSVVGIVSSWKSLQAAQKSGNRGEAAMAGAQMGSQVSGLAIGMGMFKGDRGTGRYGGKMSGDYADVGGQVGGAIGAIVGSFIPVIGTALGSVIGSVLGTLVGGMIKKGAQEGIVRIKAEAGKLNVSMLVNEGGLGKVMSGVGRSVRDAVVAATTMLGGTIESMPEVGMKLRDDIISVTVGAAKAKFKEMDDAIKFAVTEMLKQGEISGLGENVKAALKNTMAESLDELMSDLEFALSLDNLGIDEAAIQVRNLGNAFQLMAQKAQALGLDIEKVGALWGQQMQGLRDSILGVQEDPKERIRRQAEAFNAEVKMMEAELLTKIADLTVKRELLAAQQEIVAAEQQVGMARLQALGNMVRIEGQIALATGRMAGAMVGSLAAIDAALAAANAQLQNLPKLITEGEIQQAIARAGRGSGGGRDRTNSLLEQIKASLDKIADLQKELTVGSLSPNTGRVRVEAAQAEYERLRAMYESGGRRQRAQAMEQLPDALRTYLELFRSTYGSTGAYGDVAQGADEFLKQILREHGRKPYGEQAPTNDSMSKVMQDSFKRDGRGRLETRDPELDIPLQLANTYAERTSRETLRMANILEDMAANQARATSQPNARPIPTPTPGGSG